MTKSVESLNLLESNIKTLKSLVISLQKENAQIKENLRTNDEILINWDKTKENSLQ